FDVFHSYHTAWSSCSDHTLKHLVRLRQMGEKEATVDKIVDIFVSKLSDIPGPKDGGKIVPSDLLAGEFQAAFISVKAHRPACWTDTESELERDGPDAAADIQASHGLANANSPKERFRRRPFRTGEELQPLYRLVAASENVGVVFLKFAH